MLMKAQVRVDVQHHSFLNSMPDGVVGQRYAPATSPGNSPDTQCTGGWMGPRDSLGGCGEEETSFPLPVFETRTFQRVTSRYASYHELYMLFFLRRKI
jgi:hypothetical protein